MTDAQKAAAKQAKANGILFPEKYRKSLKGAAIVVITKYRAEHPDHCLQQALAHLMSTANPKMPPLYLLELTQHTIETWVALEEQASLAETSEAVAA